ncbi:substrate-binding domain-containing protein [Corallincola platygyrae]|uniref:Substrate-binding domain-containing protein n=1 Tax=Corallincola platygyrae TaxID=1193278 RepID=A0ABW4XR86_9GAMM
MLKHPIISISNISEVVAVSYVSRLLVVLTSFFAISCSDPTPTEPDAATGAKPKVLLVMKSLVNPFYLELEKGAKRAAKEQGIELIVRSGTNETLVEQQAELIDKQLRMGIDAIVIAPADSVRIVPVLKKASLAGIKLINIDNRISQKAVANAGLSPIPFVSVDNNQGGYLAAQHLVEKTKLLGQRKALIIEGPRAAANARQRREGAKRAFAESPSVNIVGSEVGNWHLEQAYAITKRVHNEHPDLALIFCANDMMALGAALYLQENKLKQIKIAGYDDIPDARTAIQDGWMMATIDQQAEMQGYAGVVAAAKQLRGEKVEDEVIVDVKLITAKDI